LAHARALDEYTPPADEVWHSPSAFADAHSNARADHRGADIVIGQRAVQFDTRATGRVR